MPKTKPASPTEFRRQWVGSASSQDQDRSLATMMMPTPSLIIKVVHNGLVAAYCRHFRSHRWRGPTTA